MSDPSADFIEKFLLKKSSLLTIVSIGIAIWLASGLYIVNPGEMGVVRLFGKEVSKASAGLNYRLPWPIQQANIVNVEEVRRLEVGFRSFSGGRTQRAVEESLMLTGDENIVEAQIIVQYKIKDASSYLFRIYQPEMVLRGATEVALRSAVGRTNIDEVLTVGRTKVQDDTRIFLQRLMDDYQSGIAVTEVKLQVVDPPDQVKDAFHEVVRAREDREKLINQAKGYQEDIIPKARGRAEVIIREAEAYHEERVLKANGDAARFLELFKEYQNAKEITKDRLHFETIERILPGIQKAIIDPSVSKNLVPILSLKELQEVSKSGQSEGGVL